MVNIAKILSRNAKRWLLSFNAITERLCSLAYPKGYYVKPLKNDKSKVLKTADDEFLFYPLNLEEISDTITLQLKSSDNVIIKVENGELFVLNTSTFNLQNIIVDVGSGDVIIDGKSVKNFMQTHTHTDSQGGTTSPPNPI